MPKEVGTRGISQPCEQFSSINNQPSFSDERNREREEMPAHRHQAPFSIAGCQTAHLFTDDVSPSMLAGRQRGAVPGPVILSRSGIVYWLGSNLERDNL